MLYRCIIPHEQEARLASKKQQAKSNCMLRWHQKPFGPRNVICSKLSYVKRKGDSVNDNDCGSVIYLRTAR
jgi:hypothetical protein